MTGCIDDNSDDAADNSDNIDDSNDNIDVSNCVTIEGCLNTDN